MKMLRTLAHTVKLYLTQNRKAVCEEMPDRAVAAGVEREEERHVGRVIGNPLSC